MYQYWCSHAIFKWLEVFFENALGTLFRGVKWGEIDFPFSNRPSYELRVIQTYHKLWKNPMFQFFLMKYEVFFMPIRPFCTKFRVRKWGEIDFPFSNRPSYELRVIQTYHKLWKNPMFQFFLMKYEVFFMPIRPFCTKFRVREITEILFPFWYISTNELRITLI